MKMFFFWILFLTSATMYAAVDVNSVAYVRDNAVVAAPVKMPIVGVRLDNDKAVFNLWAADVDTQVACGWYELRPFDRTTLQTNEYVSARSWKVYDTYVGEEVTIAWRKPKVEVSRRKLAELVMGRGWSQAFMGFINSNPEVAVRWYSSEKLIAESEEMKPFIEGFCALIGLTYEQAVALLETCHE